MGQGAPDLKLLKIIDPWDNHVAWLAIKSYVEKRTVVGSSLTDTSTTSAIRLLNQLVLQSSNLLLR